MGLQCNFSYCYDIKFNHFQVKEIQESKKNLLCILECVLLQFDWKWNLFSNNNLKNCHSRKNVPGLQHDHNYEAQWRTSKDFCHTFWFSDQIFLQFILFKKADIILKMYWSNLVVSQILSLKLYKRQVILKIWFFSFGHSIHAILFLKIR